uniref:Uncharacterized protein n=1 Tax=viral metagenome TaxID=1070528 RepID=A0A6C0H484_9ZZZZ
MFALLLLIQTLFSYIMPTNNPKTLVHLHLEKFNNELNLYHIGISFKNEDTIIRYDYRPFCDPTKCEYKTINNIGVSSTGVINKELRFIDKLYRFYIPETLANKTIYWGETSKTLDEVVEFEKTLQKKYILGINDCRHYVNRFSRWALNKRTPIWKLDKLWNQSYAYF